MSRISLATRSSCMQSDPEPAKMPRRLGLGTNAGVEKEEEERAAATMAAGAAIRRIAREAIPRVKLALRIRVGCTARMPRRARARSMCNIF